MSRAVRGQGAELALDGTADAARGDAADAVVRVRRERVRATVTGDARRDGLARAIAEMTTLSDLWGMP